MTLIPKWYSLLRVRETAYQPGNESLIIYADVSGAIQHFQKDISNCTWCADINTPGSPLRSLQSTH